MPSQSGPSSADSSTARVRVAEFLRARVEPIVQRWTGLVLERVAPARNLAFPMLRDHMPDMVRRLAEVLCEEGPRPEPLLDLPSIHALERLDEGFDLAQVATEYRLLRRAILEQMNHEHVEAAFANELILLHDAIDKAVASSVERYTRGRNRTLVALDRISQVALGSSTAVQLEQLLPRLLTVLMETTAVVDSAAILLVEGEVLRVRAAVGAAHEGTTGKAVRIGECIAGAAAQSQQPVLIRNAATDERVTSATLRKTGTRAVYAVPMLQGEVVIAVAMVGSRSSYEFSEEDLLLMRTMANRATSLIVQAQLRAAAQQARGEAEAQRALLRAVIEEMPAAVFVAEAPSGRLIMGNRRIAEVLRHPFHAADDVGGYAQYRGFHPDGRAYRPEDWPLARAVQKGVVVHDEETIVERGDGTRGVFLLSAAPIHGDDGRITYGVVTVIDITELRSAHQELQRRAEALQRAHEVLEHGQAVVVLDPGFRITFSNAEHARLSQQPREAMLGRRIDEVFPDLRTTEYWGAYQRAMHERVPVQTVGHYAPLELWTSISVYPLADGSIAAFFHDLTQQKRAELALVESEERFRQIANALPQIVWTATPEFFVDWYNDWWFKYLGLPRGTRWDDPDTSPMHPDDVERTRPRLKEAMETGNDFLMEQRFRRGSDGQYRWHRVHGVPIRAPNGKIVKWVGANTDVHDQREAAGALEESRQRLQLVVEGANLGTFEFELQSGLVQFNEATRGLFGFEGAALGRSVADFIDRIHQDDRERFRETLARAQEDAAGSGYYQHEYRTRGEGGRERWVSSRGRALFDEAGRPVRIIGVLMDITERKHEEEFRERFLGIVSHDLRNPLSTIRTSATLLNRAEDFPDKFRRNVNRMAAAADRMARMISELLDFTRGRLGNGIPSIAAR